MYNFAPHELAAIEQMKKLDPQQQQQYVNNKVGQMPIYQLMAMQNEVKRQQMMQAALPQQQLPQSTVAQDLQQQLGQGIASQPVHNVGNPQSYAGGGIVAFDDGGEVQHFDGRTGSQVQGGPTWSPEEQDRFDKISALRDRALSDAYAWDDSQERLDARSVWPQFEPEYNRLIGKRNAAERERSRREAREQMASRAKGFGLDFPSQESASGAPQAKPGEQPAAAADYEGLAALLKTRKPDDEVGGGYRVSMPNFGAAPKMELPNTAYLADKRKQLHEEEAKLGTDKNEYLRKDMADREAIEKELGLGKAAERQAELIAKREKEIPSTMKGVWQAVSRAGFAFAGSKNLAEGIKNGSDEGFNFYMKFQDHRRDLQDKLDNAQFQLDASQEAVKAGRLTAAEAGYKEQKNTIRSIQDQIASAEAADRKLFYTESGENFRAELARRTQVAVAELSARAGLKNQALLNQIIDLKKVMIDPRQKPGVRVAAQNNLKIILDSVGEYDKAQAQGDIAKVEATNAGLMNSIAGGNMQGFKVLGKE